MFIVLHGRIHIYNACPKQSSVMIVYRHTFITSNFENGEVTGNSICGKKNYFAIGQLRSKYIFNVALQGFMNSYVHRACCANSIYFLKYCILKPKQNRRLVPICRTHSLGLF
jgi:hypothetical protein